MKKKTKQLLISTVGAAGLLLASAQAVSANTTAEVHQGDTVWGIAHNNNVSIQSIETLNKISSQTHIIFPGQKLEIPSQQKAAKTAANTQTGTYVVKAGDTLWDIARAHQMSVSQLRKLNNLAANSDLIQIGQVLKVAITSQNAVKSTTAVQKSTPAASSASQAPANNSASSSSTAKQSAASSSSVASAASSSAVQSSSSSQAASSSAAKQANAAVSSSAVSSSAVQSSSSSQAASSSAAKQANSAVSSSAASSFAASSSAASNSAAAQTSSASSANTASASSTYTIASKSSQTQTSYSQQSPSVTSPKAAAYSQTQTSSTASTASQTSQSQPSSTAQTTTSNSAVVAIAEKYLGTPYVWGGTSPKGFDCSGFTQYVYSKIGKQIGRTTVAQESAGTQIPVSQAQAGDLLFWGSKGASYHVAISTGGTGYIASPEPGKTVSYGSTTYYKPSFAVHVN